MKQINIYFEDEEFEDLKDIKQDTSWHDFIMQLAKKEGDVKKE